VPSSVVSARSLCLSAIIYHKTLSTNPTSFRSTTLTPPSRTNLAQTPLRFLTIRTLLNLCLPVHRTSLALSSRQATNFNHLRGSLPDEERSNPFYLTLTPFARSFLPFFLSFARLLLSRSHLSSPNQAISTASPAQLTLRHSFSSTSIQLTPSPIQTLQLSMSGPTQYWWNDTSIEYLCDDRSPEDQRWKELELVSAGTRMKSASAPYCNATATYRGGSFVSINGALSPNGSTWGCSVDGKQWIWYSAEGNGESWKTQVLCAWDYMSSNDE
jgi:hypothetical protein